MLQDETLSGFHARLLMKLTDEVDKIRITGAFSNPRTNLMKSFFNPVINFAVFEPNIQTDFNSLEFGHLRLFWWIIR